MLTDTRPAAPAAPRGRRPRRRTVVALLATLAVLAPVAWFWAASLPAGSWSVTEMGVPDDGGGPAGMAGHDMAGMAGRSVDTLRLPAETPADARITLTARADGSRYTLNGQTPGPEIRAVAGQVVEVRLVNADVARGITLHWHGLDVPNGDDGVAGVTQDAVLPGGEFVYRFRATQVGTYWYHSHQVADEQVKGGLFGSLVVVPPEGVGPEATALVHLFGGRRTVNGTPGDLAVPAAPGQTVRVRLTNTDDGPMRAWSAAPYRVLAVDGTEVNGPTPVSGAAVGITAGGRVDLEVTAPARIELGGAAVVVGGGGAPSSVPAASVDLLSYGTPAPLRFDPTTPNRIFDYAIGRRPGFIGGVPGLYWTINGRMYPDVPMYEVREGDVVRMRISNSSGEVHPMHLHGHHAVVLARDGVPSTGSPWWIDSLDVPDGATFDIAFVADNPGIWMDHCHNLTHPKQGLVAHLMYEGVTTPYRAGPDTPNDPE
ncbi:multicopper oxidase family protein [Actinomycetospora termitidis]|uniref:Multicopper oxidase family protein n=1 Tax=Actinomycetospora termitidis TaxID=3053470 RepID=A0ABT7MEU8_9PSEU|nr:multicopper oxidase family protein [Actinomycetospora sp. Odt1-22]MDL5159183.1 multicopper oxidase family protein [Actinomycetospora sp. Odt1-22]